MRGWRLTGTLAFIAVLAALLAPRLQVWSAPQAMATIAPVAEPSPMRPAVHQPPSSLIPEVQSVETRRVLVPTRVVEPPPQQVWDSCPGCGMG